MDALRPPSPLLRVSNSKALAYHLIHITLAYNPDLTLIGCKGHTLEASTYYLKLWRAVHRALDFDPETEADPMGEADPEGRWWPKTCTTDPRLFQGAGSSYLKELSLFSSVLTGTVVWLWPICRTAEVFVAGHGPQTAPSHNGAQTQT